MGPYDVLVLDTASPVVSVAIARQGEVVASATLELRRTSERLLSTVQDLLDTAQCRVADLAGIAALQGPGSFTGLRIGLATVLGWHQALGLPVTAVPTLPLLALAEGREQGPGSREVVAAVNAMRGDWMIQRFRVPEESSAWPEAVDAARLVPFDALAELALPIIGFEMPEAPELDLRPAQPLAPIAARLLSLALPETVGDDAEPWQAGRLMQPIYFRPPAVTLPKAKTVRRATLPGTP